jgi:hypothetical protein
MVARPRQQFARRWWIASLVFMLACQQERLELSYPKLALQKSGIGEDDASLSFTIDTEGRFHRDSHWNDFRKSEVLFKNCDGSLGPDEVASLFADLQTVELSSKSRTFDNPSNGEYTKVSYLTGPGEELYPTDDAEIQRLAALLMDLHARAPRSLTCKDRRDEKRDD